MINKSKTLELLNHINNSPMSKENIAFLYSTNSIKYEKCELFGDFVQSLLNLVFDTYMGDEMYGGEEITDIAGQKSHYKWCWDKTVEMFKKEGIFIGDYKSQKYFMDFMLFAYYPQNKSALSNLNINILTLWDFLLNYNNLKSKPDVETLIEVYKLFDNSLAVKA